jgi:hypothetical protein
MVSFLLRTDSAMDPSTNNLSAQPESCLTETKNATEDPSREPVECTERASQYPLKERMTILPKHLELFAQAIADGCNVREAATRCGRKEGSGGYLNSRADVTQRIAEIRSAMAKAAENDAATRIVGQSRSIDIDRNDIIMGLVDIARSGSAPAGARVSAWLGLADIFLLRPKRPEDLKHLVGWTEDELVEATVTGVVPPRIASIIGSNSITDLMPSGRSQAGSQRR